MSHLPSVAPEPIGIDGRRWAVAPRPVWWLLASNGAAALEPKPQSQRGRVPVCVDRVDVGRPPYMTLLHFWAVLWGLFGFLMADRRGTNPVVGIFWCIGLGTVGVLVICVVKPYTLPQGKRRCPARAEIM